MPNWSGGILTIKGQALQAKVDAGQTTLAITKMKIGSGVLPSGQTLQALNDLVIPELIVPISNISASGNITTITGVITNTGVTNGFSVRELGIFAQDPTLGEILYSITIDSAPDYLPPEGGAVTVSEEFAMNIVVSNTATVTASISPTGLVTATILNQKISDHNNDQDAHGNRYLKLAGGTMTGPITLAADPTADMQAATKIYADNNGGVNLRKNSHAYAVGDICYSKSAASYKYMQCTVAGTTAATEPTWPDVGQTITDGGVTWVVRDIRAGEQVGSIKAWLANAAPPGWLALDTGALVSRATYPQLWAWVQAYAPLVTEAAWQTQAAAQTSVGAYSTGDGSTTFRLPRIVDFVRGSDGTRLPGAWQKGTLQAIDSDPAVVDPTALAGTTINAGMDMPSLINYSNVKIGYIANGTNVTLATSNSGVVRPNNIAMLYCVKSFDAPTNQGLVDLTALANSVAGKQSTIKTIILNETQASGTQGGTFTAGAWRQRIINTIVTDQTGQVTLINNQFTLPAGTYSVYASVPASNVNGHKAMLYNVTDAAATILGTAEYSSVQNSGQVISRSLITGMFTIAATKTFEIDHWGQNTLATTGFGVSMGNIGANEVYTIVVIRKVG